MSYSEVLSNTIRNSKMTSKEIIEKCNVQYNVKISESYLSQLKTGKQNSPAPEISKALAKVCGIDEKLLILESYLEGVPKEIDDFFKAICNVAYPSYDINQPFTIAEFIVSVLNNYYMSPKKPKDISILTLINFSKFIESLKNIGEDYELVIDSNILEPLIPKNARVKFSRHKHGIQYDDQDLLVYTKKGSIMKHVIQYHSVDDKILLSSVNPKEKSSFQIFNNWQDLELELDIYGKITSYVYDI